MKRFDPQPGDSIVLERKEYQFRPHPAVPSMAFGQEGRKAIVYQVQRDGQLYALKVFKRQFRGAYLVDVCRKLARLVLRGLEVCARHCLTQATARAAIEQHPELEFAVVMPWIQGATWFDIVFSGTALPRNACLQLARNAASVLAELEKRGYAHCDVAGSNVIVNTQTGKVSFIDVEDMFGPDLSAPAAFPQGTAGYHHPLSRSSAQGQWMAAGDRFSAAILLAEMLAWHSPEVRNASEEEHYFAEEELQDPSSQRYRLLVDTLADQSPALADCFARAWRAPEPAACPSLTEWATKLGEVKASDWMPIQAPVQPYRPVSWTPILEPKAPTADAAGDQPLEHSLSDRQTTKIPAAHTHSGRPQGAVSDMLPIQVMPSSSYQPEFVDIQAGLPLRQTDRPPRTPPFFRISRAADTGLYTLRWLAVQDAETYIVEAASSPQFTDAREVYRGAATVWSAPQTADGTTTFYRVCACNARGRSDWSYSVQTWG